MQPRLQHRMFGRPPQIDGQTLASDLHVFLELAKVAGNDTLTGGLPPHKARAYVRRSVASSTGRPIPMAELLKFEVPGPGGPLAARLYVPHGAPPPPRPMLLHFHGGGWMAGDLDTHDSPCRFLAAHSGVTVLSTTYRLAPEHPFPAAVEDAQASYRWAFALAGELGADPSRIAVGGDSAGANLASGVCIAMRDQGGPRAAMQLLIYPATDAIEVRPSRRLFASGFILTQMDIDHCEKAYLPDKSLGYQPACLDPPRPRPLQPPSRLHRDGRLRPIARRGRGVRGAPPRLRRAGGAAPSPEADPHLRQPDRRHRAPPAPRCSRRRVRCVWASPPEPLLVVQGLEDVEP